MRLFWIYYFSKRYTSSFYRIELRENRNTKFDSLFCFAPNNCVGCCNVERCWFSNVRQLWLVIVYIQDFPQRTRNTECSRPTYVSFFSGKLGALKKEGFPTISSMWRQFIGYVMISHETKTCFQLNKEGIFSHWPQR